MLRKLILVAGLLALAGCETSGPTGGTPSAFDIRGVDVSFLSSAQQLEDRGADIPREQVRADITRTVGRELEKISSPSGRPVRVAVAVERIELESMIERAVAISSYATAQVTVEAVEGGRVAGPIAVRGNTQTLPTFGAVGVLTTKQVMDDYRATLDSLAAAVASAVSGL